MSQSPIFFGLLAFALSLLGNLLIIQWAKRFRLLAYPRARDHHRRPTVRLGGLAIFFSLLVSTYLAFHFDFPDYRFTTESFFGFDRLLLGLLVASLLLVGAMVVDDLKGLSVGQKLLAQLLAVLTALSAGYRIEFFNNPFGNIIYLTDSLAWLLTLVWFLILMNVVNLLDGLDGLAGGVSSIGFLVISFLALFDYIAQPATHLLSLIALGATLGFLVLNWRPAKIFMGDAGSHLLGFWLAALAIISGGKVATVALVLGLPILDAALVFFRRLKERKNPLTTPDTKHLHHRLIAAGLSDRAAVLTFYLIAGLFGLIALNSSSLGKLRSGLLLVVVLSAIFFLTTPRKAG